MDVAIPVSMTRAEYVHARAAFYRSTGVARDDRALPFPVPPGSILARKITGFVERPAPGTSLGAVGVVREPIFGDPASDYAIDPALYARADEANAINVERMRAAIAAPKVCPVGSRKETRSYTVWGAPVFYDVCVAADGQLVPEVEGPSARPLDLAPFAVRGLSIPPAQLPQDYTGLPSFDTWRAAQAGEWALDTIDGEMVSIRDGAGADARDHAWWASTPFAAEVVTYKPPRLRGAYNTYEPPIEIPVGRGRLVAIRDPHPEIPDSALPPAAVPGRFLLRTSYTGGDQHVETYRLVRTADVVLFHMAHRHGLIEVQLDGAPEPCLIGLYTDHVDGNFWKSRDAAIIGLAVIAIVGLVFIAGTPGLLGAAGAGSGSVIAGAGIPLGVQLAVGTTLVAAAAVGTVETAAGVELPGFGGLEAIREFVKGTTYLAGFDGPWGEIARWGGILAQLPERRDRLRIDVAEMRARIAAGGGETLIAARLVWSLVLLYGASDVTGGLTVSQEAATKVAEEAVEQLVGVLQAQGQAELIEAVQTKVRDYQLAQIDGLIAELNREAHTPSVLVEDVSTPAVHVERGADGTSPPASTASEPPTFAERLIALIGRALEALRREINEFGC